MKVLAGSRRATVSLRPMMSQAERLVAVEAAPRRTAADEVPAAWSKYMFISSMITPFSRSISSAGRTGKLRNMSEITSERDMSRCSAAHLT